MEENKLFEGEAARGFKCRRVETIAEFVSCSRLAVSLATLINTYGGNSVVRSVRCRCCWCGNVIEYNFGFN